jgi:hypothetical protein
MPLKRSDTLPRDIQSQSMAPLCILQYSKLEEAMKKLLTNEKGHNH